MMIEEQVVGEFEKKDMVLAKRNAAGQPLPKQVRRCAG